MTELFSNTSFQMIHSFLIFFLFLEHIHLIYLYRHTNIKVYKDI